MLRPRFYTPQGLQADKLLTLEPEPSRHIAKALRMQPGDALCLFNGQGLEARATIDSISKQNVLLRVLSVETISRESPLAIALLIAVSRGERMDLVIQKATELGVSAIWPLFSERAGVRLDARRLEKKHGHWERIAISACEQCGRNRLPLLHAPENLAAQLDLERASSGPEALRILLHPGEDEDAAVLPADCPSLTLLVGPEGGFSEAEVRLATAAGFRARQLGPRILRTETAPLAAIAAAQGRWGDVAL